MHGTTSGNTNVCGSGIFRLGSGCTVVRLVAHGKCFSLRTFHHFLLALCWQATVDCTFFGIVIDQLGNLGGVGKGKIF